MIGEIEILRHTASVLEISIVFPLEAVKISLGTIALAEIIFYIFFLNWEVH